MADPVNTGKVQGRRRLCFEGLDDILADVDKLAVSRELRTLGNWSPGQILEHLAIVMNKSIDGFTSRPPAIIRLIVWLFFKRRFLYKPMSAGFKLPANAQAELVAPPPIELDAGVRSMRQAIARLKAETRRFPHIVLGPLTIEEWNQLHCRHAELHLSFLVPGD